MSHSGFLCRLVIDFRGSWHSLPPLIIYSAAQPPAIASVFWARRQHVFMVTRRRTENAGGWVGGATEMATMKKDEKKRDLGGGRGK